MDSSPMLVPEEEFQLELKGEPDIVQDGWTVSMLQDVKPRGTENVFVMAINADDINTLPVSIDLTIPPTDFNLENLILNKSQLEPRVSQYQQNFIRCDIFIKFV